jgi:organic radical activating enzyme
MGTMVEFNPDRAVNRVFVFNVTYKCNLRCSYCGIPYINTDETNFGYWTVLLDKIFKEYNWSDVVIVVSGGEPFLYENLFRIINNLHDYNFRYIIDTNGTVTIRQNMAKCLKYIHKFNSIRISIQNNYMNMNYDIDEVKKSIEGYNTIYYLISNHLVKYPIINIMKNYIDEDCTPTIKKIKELSPNIKIVEKTICNKIDPSYAKCIRTKRNIESGIKPDRLCNTMFINPDGKVSFCDKINYIFENINIFEYTRLADVFNCVTTPKIRNKVCLGCYDGNNSSCVELL